MSAPVLAADLLTAGDVIPPPAHERRWLWRDGVRRMVTVETVAEGEPDRRGRWLIVSGQCLSPNRPGETFRISFRIRPTTRIRPTQEPAR